MITNVDSPRYTEDDVKKLLEKQAFKLAQIKQVTWLTKTHKFNLTVHRVIQTDEGLIIEVS
jgi:hypothetical protein